jgi:hypothetical protein
MSKYYSVIAILPLARHMKLTPHYVICGQNLATRSDANCPCQEVMNYWVLKWRVECKEITFIDGGHCDEFF